MLPEESEVFHISNSFFSDSPFASETKPNKQRQGVHNRGRELFKFRLEGLNVQAMAFSSKALSLGSVLSLVSTTG